MSGMDNSRGESINKLIYNYIMGDIFKKRTLLR